MKDVLYLIQYNQYQEEVFMEQIMKGTHFILMYSCMLTFQFFLQYAFKHLEQVFILPFFATAVST